MSWLPPTVEWHQDENKREVGWVNSRKLSRVERSEDTSVPSEARGRPDETHHDPSGPWTRRWRRTRDPWAGVQPHSVKFTVSNSHDHVSRLEVCGTPV